MAFQVDTVFVWVTDLDRSVEWYAELGIAAGPRYGAWQAMAVDGEPTFALHEGDSPRDKATESTDDETTDTSIARFTTFSDPDGNDIQLLERM